MKSPTGMEFRWVSFNRTFSFTANNCVRKRPSTIKFLWQKYGD